jgi:hypothetical protein
MYSRFGLEDLIDLAHIFFCDDRAQANVFDFIRWDENGAAVFE